MAVEEIYPIYQDIATANTAMAVVYRLTDSGGAIWRSTPRLMTNAVYAADDAASAIDQWLIIPTLRHLMEGTTAQIEVYIASDVDLELFYVIENDPTVDYIEFCVNIPCAGRFWADRADTPTINEAIESVTIGETLYTTGGALANDPPPQMECCALWRNRVFGCFQNSVYPSQEFATGLGLQWSSYLRVEWADGTGDILGVCPIDWNYLAVFKRDAIGIISGGGPDAMGHGNYIVQTLTTKAGCTNPRSLVNAADGCYYQDAQTNRVMLLSPDLQVREAMPGAFDKFAESAVVYSALHDEATRQIWFSTAARLLVLDYKHRTPSTPLGQVYQWPITGIGTAKGLAIVSSSPVLMMSDGMTAKQTASQYYDLTSGGTKTAVNRTIETGDISPFGLLRSFNVSRIAVLGEYLSEHNMTISAYPQYATSTTGHSVDITTGPAEFVYRPEGCMGISAVRIKLVEEVYTAPDFTIYYGAALKFVGFALELQDKGGLQSQPAGRLF